MYASKMFGIDYLPTNFQIQISRDNINWEEITNEKSYDIQDTNADSWDLDNPEARYIKVSITKAKTFFIFYLVQIAEIEVYGCDTPEQTLLQLEKDSLSNNKKPEENNKEETGNPQDFDNQSPTIPGKPVIAFPLSS